MRARRSCSRAYDADWGPIQYEGNLHDRATYRYYWEAIQRAHVQNMELKPQVLNLFFREAVPA